MIHASIILSLQITAIYILFQPGMLLGWFKIIGANVIDWVCGVNKCNDWRHISRRQWSRYIQKPLWDCLPCMSSVWTIILTRGFHWRLILLVMAINVFIEKIIEDGSSNTDHEADA